jgi:hypothetical protein
MDRSPASVYIETSTNFLDPAFPMERTYASLMSIPYLAKGTAKKLNQFFPEEPSE